MQEMYRAVEKYTCWINYSSKTYKTFVTEQIIVRKQKYNLKEKF